MLTRIRNWWTSHIPPLGYLLAAAIDSIRRPDGHEDE